MRMRYLPHCDPHEPPKPHGFIFASVPRGSPARFIRMANRQGLQQLAPLSVHSPQPVHCHAAPPC